MMRALLWLWIALLLPSAAAAQDPQVRLELAAEETEIGQPLILRLTVLVPSFMPDPPSLPSFEIPDLMVRLNDRATTPTSQQVDGETWSGITRSYSLYPMIPGPFVLPPQEVAITYAADGATPETTTVMTEEIRFEAILPEGAEGLDPPLIASDLTTTQQITLPEGDLAVGDAITRQIVVKIEGTPPLFIPPLIGTEGTEALRPYPKEPVLEESENRGILSGTRTETVTYVALAEGTATLPPLSLSWYNLSSKAVETIELDGTTVEVAAGPPAPFRPDPGQIAGWLLALIALGSAAFFGWRRFGPGLRARARARRAARQVSEAHLYKTLEQAVGARDLTLSLQALRLYETHHPEARRPADLDAALHAVTEIRFGRATLDQGAITARWAALHKALPGLRPHRVHKAEQTLPALNPF